MSESPIPRENTRRRVFFYVDGFNLYYGALRFEPSLKWLNVRELAAKQIFPEDSVEMVRYFTALVDKDDPASHKKQRQQTYLAALRSTGIKPLLGVMRDRTRRCRATNCDLREEYDVPVEKMTDVNLALTVYVDYLASNPDVVCILSADSDLIPAFRAVQSLAGRNKRPVKLIMLLPNDARNFYLSRLEDANGLAEIQQLTKAQIAASLFPPQIILRDGTQIIRPAAWV